MREVSTEETLKIDKSGCFLEVERQGALVQDLIFVLFCLFFIFYATCCYKPFSTIGF